VGAVAVPAIVAFKLDSLARAGTFSKHHEHKGPDCHMPNGTQANGTLPDGGTQPPPDDGGHKKHKKHDPPSPPHDDGGHKKHKKDDDPSPPHSDGGRKDGGGKKSKKKKRHGH
jgi:hypothetical protein